MTKRELKRMDRWERQCVLNEAVEAVDSTLNLFGGAEILAEMEAQGADRYLDRLLEPECSCRRGCDHSFPPHFVRSARPAVQRLRRLWHQLEQIQTT